MVDIFWDIEKISFCSKLEFNMLTKIDLKQIQRVVHDESRKVVKEENKNLASKSDLKKELDPIKKDISKIRKDINAIIGFFDTEYLELRKRVERIEDHLNLPPIAN